MQRARMLSTLAPRSWAVGPMLCSKTGAFPGSNFRGSEDADGQRLASATVAVVAAAFVAGRWSKNSPSSSSRQALQRRFGPPGSKMLLGGRRLYCQSTSSQSSGQGDGSDPHVWLEEVLGQEALAWVEGQNQRVVQEVCDPKETESYRRILAILDSKEKIPTVQQIGDLYYNFWQDEQHKKGIWRRTTLESFKTAAPVWETVLDLDQLAEKEGISWVWKGFKYFEEGPSTSWDRGLVKLSPGGSDAAVHREFDLNRRAFITPEQGGFYVPEAKSDVDYRTRDELLVGTDFGPGSLTSSGYPRIAKSWRRGTPLSEAVTVFEGREEDVSAGQYMHYDRGVWHEQRYRSLDFYRTLKWYRPGDPKKTAADGLEDGWVQIPVPDDASVSTFKDAAIISLRSEWTTSGHTFKAGALLSLPVSKCMAGDFSTAQVVFEPTERTSLQEKVQTKEFMVLSVLDNIRTQLRYLKYRGDGQWVACSDSEGGGVPVGCDITVSAVSSQESNDLWFLRYGYLQPDLLQLASAADCGSKPLDLKAKPAFFDASGIIVEQWQAKSADGTQVPYFLMRPRNALLDGSLPTLLDGYGGFEISMTPYYSAGVGAAWLERGGCKVVANIRGGGEFGPSWHQAALQANRKKSYEDFEAVAKDLIQRGVTKPERLACIGGSNGGLLVGNMLTREGGKLFGAAVCQVPLLDMKRYTKLLAGASWMAEYGDPDKPEEWSFLQNYSPYHRVKDVCLGEPSWTCPQVLFTTSTRDDRVHPGHARKMVKRLLEDVPRARAPKVLYWENTEGGHGGAADNPQRAYMWALTYEFLWRTIGGEPKPHSKL